jgi:AraC-like DNA-binding protein
MNAAVEIVCVDAIANEHAMQKADARGRFVSKQREALGNFDGGQLTRRVTAYVSAKGCGYEISFHFKKGSRTWRRVVNTGPEAYRNASWFEEMKPKVQ